MTWYTESVQEARCRPSMCAGDIDEIVERVDKSKIVESEKTNRNNGTRRKCRSVTISSRTQAKLWKICQVLW